MNARSVASLALKLIGVFVLVNRLEYLVYVVLAAVQQRLGTMPGGTCNSPWRILVLVGPFLLVAVCLFLIFDSHVLARRLVPDDGKETGGRENSLDATSVQTIAFSVVGLMLFVRGLSALIPFALSYTLASETWIGHMTVSTRTSLLSAVAKMLIGAALFFRPDVLVRLQERLRKTDGDPESGNPSARDA